MAPGALRAAVLLLLLGLGVSARAPPETAEPGLSQAELTQMFEDFVIRFNKTYGSPEERRRRLGIFARAMEDARRLREAPPGSGPPASATARVSPEPGLGQAHATRAGPSLLSPTGGWS
ncbi:cathepsin W-like [Alligator mississippiensis]|uniref:cathepsin W-like n=1 Tax=Alligator mississippiensis TaxID=8496 RepID=UPI002877786C|nr:cathepsin W-like [Alligator mississippiensis]